MTTCPQSERIQRLLDGELPAGEALELRAHLEGCAACAAEHALYANVFETLAAAPLFDPPPALTERILARVLPSRARRRWVRALGWAYGGALAACAVGILALLGQPAVRHALVGLGADVSRGLVGATVLALESLGFMVISLAGGLDLIQHMTQRLAPLGRAAGALLTQPTVVGALAVALAASAVVVWWMRPRPARVVKGVPHVGLLGF